MEVVSNLQKGASEGIKCVWWVGEDGWHVFISWQWKPWKANQLRVVSHTEPWVWPFWLSFPQWEDVCKWWCMCCIWFWWILQMIGNTQCYTGFIVLYTWHLKKWLIWDCFIILDTEVSITFMIYKNCTIHWAFISLMLKFIFNQMRRHNPFYIISMEN